MSPDDDSPGSRHPTVFISYAHDDEAHRELVLRFATLLRRGGIDAHLDRWHEDGPHDWSRWVTRQVADADFVLVIASPEYKRRAEGLAKSHEGRGVQFEAALIRDYLTKDLHGESRRILPVVLPGRSIEEIPTYLGPYSRTRYVVPELTPTGISSLLTALTGTRATSAPELSTTRPADRRIPLPARTWVLVAVAVLVIAAGAVTAATTDVFAWFDAGGSAGSAPASGPPTSSVSSAPASHSTEATTAPTTTSTPAAGGVQVTSVRPTGAVKPPPGAPSAVTPQPAPAPSVRLTGSEDAVGVKEGIDLDTGARLDQEAVGVDISFSSGSSHLDSMSVRAYFTVLPEAGPEDYSRCFQATGYTRTSYPSVYELAEGRNICFKTSEARYSMVTITQRATVSSGVVSFRYTTWN